MRIAFVHDWLNGMRGGEFVLEALLDLWPDAEIFTLFYEPERVSEKIRRRPVTASPLNRLPAARRHYRSLLPLYPWAVRRFDLSAFDLTISVSHCAAKAAPAPAARHLCYCLTPMRYIWTAQREYAASGLIPRIALATLGGSLRRWDRRSSAGVGRFVAISQTVAERVKSAYGREAAVVHPPVDTEFFTPDGAPAGEYLLAVSAFVPYKRLDLAVDACARARLPLKIVGEGPGEADLRRRAGPSVEFLGRVSRERLRDLYRGCRALIFPGEEDFGLAPVEAQACGRPVIACGRGGARETVVEDRTGLFFHDPSAEAILDALDRFRPGDFDPDFIRRNAESFNPARFRAAFLAEVESFLEGGRTAVK